MGLNTKYGKTTIIALEYTRKYWPQKLKCLGTIVASSGSQTSNEQQQEQ